MIRLFLITIAALFIVTGASAQSRKEIRKNKIKSCSVTKTEDNRTVNESKTVYDKEGNEIETIDYDKNGSVNRIHTFKYNSEGDEVEDLEYNSKNELVEKKITKYNLLGEKTEEVFYDGAGKYSKKHSYTYDGKGMKTARTTYDAAGKVVTVKKYTYVIKN